MHAGPKSFAGLPREVRNGPLAAETQESQEVALPLAAEEGQAAKRQRIIFQREDSREGKLSNSLDMAVKIREAFDKKGKRVRW